MTVSLMSMKIGVVKLRRSRCLKEERLAEMIVHQV
jgi:hypothetical protein